MFGIYCGVLVLVCMKQIKSEPVTTDV